MFFDGCQGSRMCASISSCLGGIKVFSSVDTLSMDKYQFLYTK